MDNLEGIYFDLKIKIPYSWLWIKYVTGFRSNTHCMACLVGGRSDIIPPRRKVETSHPYARGNSFTGSMTEHNYKYIYLCGVTDNYADNLHVVIRYKKGGVVRHTDKHCDVTFTNAERVPIPKIAETIDRGYQHTSCRNFQMGYHYLRHTDPYDGMSAREAGIGVKTSSTKMANRGKTYERKTGYDPKKANRIRFVIKR